MYASKDSVVNPKSYTDMVFAIFWFVATASYIGFGLYNFDSTFGKNFVTAVAGDPALREIGALWKQQLPAFLGMIFMCFSAAVLSVYMVLQLANRCGSALVKGVMYFSWIWYLVLAAGCYYFGNNNGQLEFAPGAPERAGIQFVLCINGGGLVILAFGSAISAMLCMCCWGGSIKLTGKLFTVSGRVFSGKMMGSLTIYLLCGLLSTICVLLSAFAVAGWLTWMQGGADGTAQIGYFTLFCMLVMYFWTLRVLENLVHVAYCKLVGAWYFMTESEYAANVSPIAFFGHACTYHLGSVCMGSLIVACIQALRVIAELCNDTSSSNNREDGGAKVIKLIVRQIILCILASVEKFMVFISSLAYVRVAVHNEDFITAAKTTFGMFTNRHGLEAVLCNSCTNTVLNFLSFAMTCFTGLVICAGANKFFFNGTTPVIGVVPMIFGVLIGIKLAFTVINAGLQMMTSGNAAAFVLYVEQSDKLKEYDPAMVEEMEMQRVEFANKDGQVHGNESGAGGWEKDSLNRDINYNGANTY